MSGIASVIQNFRKQQIHASQIKDDAAKEREARLARQRELKARKREADTKSRAQQTDSANSSGLYSTATHGSYAGALESARHMASPATPLGFRQKAVVDYLRRVRVPQTIEEIDAALQCSLEEDGPLLRELRRNEKIAFDEADRLFYQPEIDVRDKAALLKKIQVSQRPVQLKTVLDAYPRAEKDLQELKAEGAVVGYHSFEAEINGEVLFPVDQRLASFRVDDAIANLWQHTPVPDTDDDLITAVKRAGLKPAPRRSVRRYDKVERKKATRKQAKLRSVTNVHLMHLLEGDVPATIE